MLPNSTEKKLDRIIELYRVARINEFTIELPKQVRTKEFTKVTQTI